MQSIVLANRQLSGLGSSLKNRYEIFDAWSNDDKSQAFIDAARVLVVAGEAQLDRALVKRMPKLKLIACASVGYDGIDLEWVFQRGLRLSHAQGVNDEDVADHALGCVILKRRSLLEGDVRVRAGEWPNGISLGNRSLRGLRLGIVGLGRIGNRLAERANNLGMDVRWWGPRDKRSDWPRAPSLKELACSSDALVVAARADASNAGLISGQIIDALGPKGYLVNVARGSLVDENALIAALRAGRLGGAALDVFCEEPTAVGRWRNVPRV